MHPIQNTSLMIMLPNKKVGIIPATNNEFFTKKVDSFMTELSQELKIPQNCVGICNQKGDFLNYQQNLQDQGIGAGCYISLLPLHQMLCLSYENSQTVE
ncbi:hypothetical protein SS50377_21760 [Spironucleus salmonicida]|uniref:Uncharacterized protein n=1 Tax=Spironucleus salmonicida TaxID=348837 RepID=V6LX53_9EUKA|nr:hypothetical protein SS50377_21760 [Spironucleus salmonicida]|eukprot:EST45399.1 Hypothetical protein SS50377_14674 [Spironucleus salmonicida]